MSVAVNTTDEPIEYVLDPDLQIEIQAYPGKWVAVTRSELIAVGDTLVDVLREALNKGYPTPIIHRISEANTILFL